jgi:hypothetical protein
MMSMKCVYIFLLCLLFLAGCKTEYKDISSNVEYTKILGKTYESLVPLNIYGVTLDENYKPNINVYIVTDVKLGGREKITKDVLSVGSIFKINKVMSCVKCLVSDVVFNVEIKGLEKKIPIELWDYSILDNKKKYRKMNPSLFKEISRVQVH